MARTAGWDDGALRASNDAAVSIVPPKSRVGDWRAGLGRSLCSLFPRPFGCEVSQHRDHATFPVPATSNAMGGFPALRSPVCFASRVMRPILLVRLSVESVRMHSASACIPPLPTPPPPAEALSILKPRNARTFQPSPLTYSLRLGSCTLMDAFIISSVPSRLKETLQTAGPPHSVGVTPLHRYGPHPSPSRLRSTSRFSQLYDLPCSGDFSSGARRASPVTRCV